jgi:2-aminoadipate transaminase
MTERLQVGAFRLASRMTDVAPSAVREILKVAEQPEMLSFAGGLPAPELFPVEAIAEAYAQVLAEEGKQALQYGVSEGHGPLREWIAARLTQRGLATSPEQLLITHGSQQGIDLVARALLDRGDRVIVEDPTYLAALQAFSTYEVTLVPVPSDAEGMQVDGLEEVFRRERPALLYIVPEFQNPKGTSLALPRRRKLLELARRHGVPVLEDDPYGEIRFAGRAGPSLAALDSEQVIQLGTFSKTLAPGMRIGWVRAPVEVLSRLTILKQATDLHTSTLNQRAVTRLLATFDYEGHLEKLRKVYRVRADAMDQALCRAMPPGTSWTHPEGGLFLWLQLPAGIVDDAVFQAAIARGIAVVPGHPFFARGLDHGHLRLNFSNRSEALIDTGMGILGEVVGELGAAASRAVVQGVASPRPRP